MSFAKSAIACAVAAGLVVSSYAAAAGKRVAPNTATSAATSGVGAPMAWPERQALIRTVVQKWARYVQKVRGVNATAWARSMGAAFASADPANLRRAARMDTYEGMVGMLLGHRTTDEKIIDALAKDSSPAMLAALASPASDLVYTILTPCRIIDTRIVGGKIDAATSRSFEASRPGGDFGDQGGAATDCGVPADPAAVVMNVTVVDAEGSGFLIAYPYGEAMPLASSNNYSVGRNTGNEIIVKQTIGDVADFTTYANRRVHVVADVVGYLAAPATAALDTTVANGVNNQVDAGLTYTATASCPAGYSVTGGGLVASPSSPLLTLSESYPDAGGTGWTVTGINGSGASLVVHARAICARN